MDVQVFVLGLLTSGRFILKSFTIEQIFSHHSRKIFNTGFTYGMKFQIELN